MGKDLSANAEGSGAVAQDHSVAAGAGGVAVGRDVHGDVTVVNITYQGSEISIPSPESVAAHRAALRERLAIDARRRWGGMSVYIQEEGAALPIEASPYQTGRLGPRQNLLHTLHNADRLLVLGGPGSGKTVALERLAWGLCDGPEPVMPVLVRLFHYAGTMLAEWVRSILQGMGRLRLDDERALVAFLKEGEARCVFLFDGLNEVPPPYRDRLVDELVRWMASYRRHPVILTCRAQDELWRRLREEVEQTVVVQPIGDEQAQAYLVAYLDERGEALYEQLGPRLQEMARIPLLLYLIKEGGAAGESVPGNRGELYARFVSRLLRRDTDRRMDAEIPERLKREALAALAYHLGLGKRLICAGEEATDVVARLLGDDQAVKMVGACARHGLLAGEDKVWFAPHPSVRDHFAALALYDIAETEWHQGTWGRLKRVGKRLLTGQWHGIAGMAADDWWTEAFVQLAGLTDHADHLAQVIAQARPWLAWWCVEEGRSVSEATRILVADRSIRLLRSEQVADRREAVQALAQMKNERVVMPLLQSAADADTELAGLAVETLVGLGDLARMRIAEVLRGNDLPLRYGALRYLAAQPSDPLIREIPWERLLGLAMVWVPPGPFLMGSELEKDHQALDSELPEHQIILPGYWIGQYPVTVAQFRAFAEDTGYQSRSRGTMHGADDLPAVDLTSTDALAYCHWLGQATGLPVMIPSESEWEKAARGVDGRIYPWGNATPDENLCNFDMKVGNRTSVGQYSPQGDSPYGCADMAGNVWEWTRSLWGETRQGLEFEHSYGSTEGWEEPEAWEKPEFQYPYEPGDGRERLDISDRVRRVMRGGSYADHQRFVRCAIRYGPFPDDWGRYYGFRVVVTPSASDSFGTAQDIL